MRPITSSLALVVLPLLALACGDSSDPSGLTRFEGTLPATAWVEATGGRCPGLTITVSGSGQGTPGGPLTIAGSHCLDPDGTDSEGGLYPRVTTGQFALIFGSGATLTGTYAGNLVLVETGLYGVEADLLISGGTGEFEGASGTISFVSLADSTPWRLNRETGQATKLWLSGLIVP
jgi:hypothetical protein